MTGENDCPANELERMLEYLNPALFRRLLNSAKVDSGKARLTQDLEGSVKEGLHAGVMGVAQGSLEAYYSYRGKIIKKMAQIGGYSSVGEMLEDGKARERIAEKLARHVRLHKKCYERYAIFIGDLVIGKEVDVPGQTPKEAQERAKTVDKKYLGLLVK